MWLRRLRETLARRRTDRTATALAREVREPDPYVWRLPNPYDARWRRWHKRCRAAGRHLPFPAEEACWPAPPPRPASAPWQADDDVVRPYVLRP